ncbi:hypothetical protein CDD82_619 [Ophiocordyceps australis]|uniref:Uncharacterized protein n=1 Tax=Ophiocordyceps australis TaxID=1399860 RepID=A0A2C5XR14_9HYPO|nr:hypothetical protein CDD82_619 [Ophiocordyceps australis]
MALVNPVYTFVVPFLLIVTAPLAIFAGFTTVLAFSILSLRVLVVYLDIALDLVPQCFSSSSRTTTTTTTTSTSRLRPPASTTSWPLSSSSPPPLPLPTPRLEQQQQQQQQRHGASSPRTASPARKSVNATTNSSCNSTPTATPKRQQSPLLARTHSRRPSSAAVSIVSATSTAALAPNDAAATASLGLVPSVGPGRDFEGIGGWRSGRDAQDDDDANDDAWTTFNSRFEFPDRSHPRSRHRSPCTTPGDGGVLMMRARPQSPDRRGPVTPTSPATSRPRTPSGSALAAAATDGYFSLVMSPAAATKRTTS